MASRINQNLNWSPGQRVMFMMEQTDRQRNDRDSNGGQPRRKPHTALFTKLSELKTLQGDRQEWRETARWVKFEENVHEGSDRWSQPHVSQLSLPSLFEQRSCLCNGTIILSMVAEDLPEIVDMMLDSLIEQNHLTEDNRDKTRKVLLQPHKHQHEAKPRTVSDSKVASSPSRRTNDIVRPEDVQRPESKLNTNFTKKLPVGSEACNVFTGEVSYLQQDMTAFIRLRVPVVLSQVTGIAVATRFLFICLGPAVANEPEKFRQLGRAFATMMADEIFRDVAYRARDRVDLLDGVDEFLSHITCLPPGGWDPNIRIEPPASMLSQHKRKQVKVPPSNVVSVEDLRDIGGEEGDGDGDEEDKGHTDTALRRTGRIFGGLIKDVRRKLPWYKSDFKDGLNMETLATILFMYFAILAPIVTFGGLLEEVTQQRMAAMENLVSGCLCGVIYYLLCGQPLTIIGPTGPMLVFETIAFYIASAFHLHYLSFRLWVTIWAAVILLLMVATDASSLVSYFTRFTEETFAILIATIYIFESIKKCIKILHFIDVVAFNPSGNASDCSCEAPTGENWLKKGDYFWVKRTMREHSWNPETAPFVSINPANQDVVGLNYSTMSLSQCEGMRGRLHGPGCYPLYDVFLMSVLLMAGTFLLATLFKSLRNGRFFPQKTRNLLGDFAVMLSIVIMTVLDLLVGIHTPKLYVPSSFRPSYYGREWLIPLLHGDNPWWTIPFSVLPAMLLCILIFMAQQITTVIVSRKEHKLKKGSGYHLDLLILAVLVVVVGFFGIPIYIAATVLSVNHVRSLQIQSESRAPGEAAQFIGTREQRVTGIVAYILIGLSVFMTKILSLIPMPVLFGVFLYMGVAALNGIQLYDRIKLFFIPMKYQPDTIYIRHVPIKVIHKFTAVQVICLLFLWIIKLIKSISALFPVVLILMVGVRKLMEKCFSEEDLKYLDDKMPDFQLRKKEDAKERSEQYRLHMDKMLHSAAAFHVPIATGNSLPKLFPAANKEPAPLQGKSLNLSEAMNQSSLWRRTVSGSRESLDSTTSAGQSNPSFVDGNEE